MQAYNATRRIVASDEAYFARRDFDVMEKEIRDGLHAFVAKLGG
jgi:hypothetical protein